MMFLKRKAESILSDEELEFLANTYLKLKEEKNLSKTFEQFLKEEETKQMNELLKTI